MALAISIISEEQNTYVIAFDGKPSIDEIVDGIKDKMFDEVIMSIIEWHIGFNYELGESFATELSKRINQIH
jgi:hypothetical protein